MLHLNEIEQYFIRIVLLKKRGENGKLLELIFVEFWEFVVEKVSESICPCEEQFVIFRMGLSLC